MLASTTPAIATASSGAKKSANAGQRDELGGGEEGERGERLAEPDRAAVARREHEAVERAALALGRPRPGEAEQRREDDRDPEQAVGSVVAGPGREREVEDRERREDEEQHRRQRVPGPELEPQVLARERDDVGGVERDASSSRGPAGGWRAASTRAGSWVESTIVRSPVSAASSRSSSADAFLVERGERLVEHEQRRVVEQRAAEREALRHAARVGRDAVGANVPEAEPLEQHPAALAPLGDAIEAAEEIEVLERRELAVEQRLVPEVAEVTALGVDRQRAFCRRGEPGDEPEQRRLARAVRPGDEQEARARER